MNTFLEKLKIFLQFSKYKSPEKTISRILLKNSMKISTVESCTGGLISSRLTDIAGSSAYIQENFITYSNQAKMDILGVKKETLENFGAVSEQCAIEMAEGLFKRGHSEIALATTGVAGPDTSENKPVGLIFVAIKINSQTYVKKFELNSKIERKTMKFLFSQKALEFLIELLTQ